MLHRQLRSDQGGGRDQNPRLKNGSRIAFIPIPIAINISGVTVSPIPLSIELMRNPKYNRIKPAKLILR